MNFGYGRPLETLERHQAAQALKVGTVSMIHLCTILMVPLVLLPGSNLLQVDHQLYEAIHTLSVPSNIHRPLVVCTWVLELDCIGSLRLYRLHSINVDAV